MVLKHFSTTTYYSSTTPVLLCTTKYYASTTTYYPVLQRTTPVLLCTTEYYASTTLYYKVLRWIKWSKMCTSSLRANTDHLWVSVYQRTGPAFVPTPVWVFRLKWGKKAAYQNCWWEEIMRNNHYCNFEKMQVYRLIKYMISSRIIHTSPCQD